MAASEVGRSAAEVNSTRARNARQRDSESSEPSAEATMRARSFFETFSELTERLRERLTSRPDLATRTRFHLTDVLQWAELLKSIRRFDMLAAAIDADRTGVVLAQVDQVVVLFRELLESVGTYLEIQHRYEDLPPGQSTVDRHLREQRATLAQEIPIESELCRTSIEDLCLTINTKYPRSTTSSRVWASRVQQATAAATVQGIKEIERSATEVQHSVETAAGLVGTGALAVSFESIRDRQRLDARNWLLLTMASVTVVIAVGLMLIQRPDDSWAGIVAHLVVALPAAGLAAYSARESSRHRESAHWADRISAQLTTIGAYAEKLSPTASDDLWGKFGSYIFGSSAPEIASENQLNTVPPELLKALTDLVKAANRT